MAKLKKSSQKKTTKKATTATETEKEQKPEAEREEWQTELERIGAAWDVKQMASVDDFLVTGKSGCNHNKGPIIVDRDQDVYLVRNNQLFCIGAIEYGVTGEEEFSPDKGGYDDLKKMGDPDAALIASRQKTGKFHLVVDGDDPDDGSRVRDVSVANASRTTTISYECLAQLMNGKRNAALEAVASGKLKVLDCTADERRDVTPTQKKPLAALRRKRKTTEEIRTALRPPQHGFTLIDGSKWHWHRSATVLLLSGKETWMLGQDDDTYFGVVLPDHPTTIKDAFTSLTPEPIRRIKGVLRQGEWFACPVSEKEVPAESDCLAAFDSLWMPKDDPDSNTHELSADDGRVNSEGVFARNFGLYHEEHGRLTPPSGSHKQWYRFYHNTAVRSVSQEGVD